MQTIERPEEGTEVARGVRVRRGVAEDEPAAFDVMKRAMGLEADWALHSAARRSLRESPHCSFWVAEETSRFSRPRMVAYARSIVRDGLWSLTEFFVLPAQRLRGVGGALLARCLRDGDEAGATSRMVLASHHPAALSLYIRAGCLPRMPMFLLAGPNQTLMEAALLGGIEDRRQSLPPPLHELWQSEAPSTGPLEARPILPSPTILDALAGLDRSVLGYERTPEHRYWIDQMGGLDGAARIFGDRSTGDLIGYSYYGDATTGPALDVRGAVDLPALVAHTAALLERKSRQRMPGWVDAEGTALAVPGCNIVMLQWLLRRGWRILFQYLLMSSNEPGLLDRYVCHNPLHVL